MRIYGSNGLEFDSSTTKERSSELNKFEPKSLNVSNSGMGISFGPSTKNKLNEKIQEQRALKSSKAPFEIMDVSDRDSIKAMKSVGSQLDKVEEIVKNLAPGTASGVVRKIQLSTPYLQDADLTKLNSAFGMLTSTLLKQFQGSRPSDFDYKIWEIISGKGSVSKENMLAALKYTRDYVNQNKLDAIETWSGGYGIPEEQLWKIVGGKPSLEATIKNNEPNKISKPKEINVGGTKFIITGE